MDTRGSQREHRQEGVVGPVHSSHRGGITHSPCPADPDPPPTGLQYLQGSLSPSGPSPRQQQRRLAPKLHPPIGRSHLLRKAQRGHLRSCKRHPFYFGQILQYFPNCTPRNSLPPPQVVTVLSGTKWVRLQSGSILYILSKVLLAQKFPLLKYFFCSFSSLLSFLNLSFLKPSAAAEQGRFHGVGVGKHTVDEKGVTAEQGRVHVGGGAAWYRERLSQRDSLALSVGAQIG